jgi:hypothetical protein
VLGLEPGVGVVEEENELREGEAKRFIARKGLQ